MKVRKMSAMALLMTLAMILSYIESQLPSFVAIPGIKIGLANLAVVFALYQFGWKEAALVSMVRVLILSVLFGSSVSLMYSAAGAAVSLLGMVLLKKIPAFSCMAVSVCGGVLHNIAQIGVASLVLETNVLKYYLPFLILSGTIAGIVIGILAAVMIRRIQIRM